MRYEPRAYLAEYRIGAALDGVLWMDNSIETIKRELNNTAKKVMEGLYDEGFLPYRVRHGRYIVGYYVCKTFSGCHFVPMYCGPKPPSRFRDRYLQVTAREDY